MLTKTLYYVKRDKYHTENIPSKHDGDEWSLDFQDYKGIFQKHQETASKKQTVAFYGASLAKEIQNGEY